MTHKSKIAWIMFYVTMIVMGLWFGSVVVGESLMLDKANASHNDREFQNFVIQSRYGWNTAALEFNSSRKRIYIIQKGGISSTAREAEVEKFELLEERLRGKQIILDTENATRNANNITELLANATMELRCALNAKDDEETRVHIKNANTQISMANRSLQSLAKEYDCEIGNFHYVQESIEEEF